MSPYTDSRHGSLLGKSHLQLMCTSSGFSSLTAYRIQSPAPTKMPQHTRRPNPTIWFRGSASISSMPPRSPTPLCTNASRVNPEQKLLALVLLVARDHLAVEKEVLRCQLAVPGKKIDNTIEATVAVY